MKNKIKLTTIFLLLCLTSFGQLQRMAILPGSMNYGSSNTLKTLCIDYLREAPKAGDFYDNILSFNRADKKWVKKVGSNYKIEGFEDYRAMKLKDKSGNELTPANTKQTLITGQANETISERYLQFINDKIETYRSKGSFDEYAHEELQSEIWEYNVLDNLGYLNNEGTIENDLLSAQKKFEGDWGSGFWSSKILTAGGNLKGIHSLNNTSGKDFQTLLITKTSNNEYAIFNEPSKCLFRAKDEKEVVSFLSKTYESNENIYLFLNNFETTEKQESFLSTLRIEGISKGKRLNINSLPIGYDSEIFFEKVNNLKLSKSLSSADIQSVKYNNTDYYSASFEVDYKVLDLEGYPSVIEALATKKSILEELIAKTNSIFNTLTSEISLLRFFNSFKKEIKQTMKIQNEDEFIIHIKNEFQDFRIVKISGDDTIYFASN